MRILGVSIFTERRGKRKSRGKHHDHRTRRRRSPRRNSKGRFTKR